MQLLQYISWFLTLNAAQLIIGVLMVLANKFRDKRNISARAYQAAGQPQHPEFPLFSVSSLLSGAAFYRISQPIRRFGLELCLVLGIVAGFSGASLARADSDAPSSSLPAQNTASLKPTSQVVSTSEDYQLGTQDQISIRASHVAEIPDRPIRIESTGEITLALIGRVHAAGKTVHQLEEELGKRLAPYVREPEVSVSLVEIRNQPVTVVGAVNTPGVIQLTFSHKLTDVLSLAGGLRQDAGPYIRVTRPLSSGVIPAPDVTTDTESQSSVAKIGVHDLFDARSAKLDIELKPHDVITIPKADLIYVVGEVTKPGGYVLSEHETMSVLQALSLSGGFGRSASPGHAKILRLDPNGGRTEVNLALDHVLEGRANDVPLSAGDILFVPSSLPKKAALRALEAAIQTGTGLAIWR